MKILQHLFALIATTFTLHANAQCTKDTDCKGDRICEGGICMAPTGVHRNLQVLPPSSSHPPLSSAAVSYPKFEDYPVQKYSGKLFGPKGIQQVAGGGWRNQYGKRVDGPEINFSGKYNIMLESCGTGCRYYTLTDLSTAQTLPVLSPFDSVEPAPTTKEGFTYITELLSRPESRMLVAQYDVANPKGNECRERIFLFDGTSLKPITSTKFGCTKF